MTNKKNDVLAIGELNVDLILNQIDGFPEIGKEKMAGSMLLTLGSSTAIFAANLSSLGAKVGFVGKIGCDIFGELVKQRLKEKGIDISCLIEDNNTATGATIAMNYDEDRAMVTFPGAMEYLTIDDVTNEMLLTARHIHFSSFFFQPGIRNDVHILFQRAKELGLTTSLDVQWDPSEQWDFDYKKILPFVDIFLPNEAEFMNIAKTDNFEDALKKLEPYLNTVIVKKGVEGSIMRSSNGEISLKPAYLNADVVDAIGAGDSFNAGFIYKYISGCNINECQDFGSITGALNTTAAGGTGAFVSKGYIKEVIKSKFNIDCIF